MARGQDIHRAVEALKKDRLVAFPTETVYGLGARALSARAVKRIFKAKGRPSDNPVIVHVSTRSQVNLLVREVPPKARRLMAKFWPGPLTIVFLARPSVPRVVTAGLDTVAVRMPKHPLALELLRALGEPLAAPSANRSGRPSATRAKHVKDDFGKKVDVILDAGPSGGLESTIVDATVNPMRILRPGAISWEAIQKIVPEILPWGAGSEENLPPSPGLRHRHYSPRCKVVLVEPGHWRNGYLEKGHREPFGVVHRSLVNFSAHGQMRYCQRVPGSLKIYAQELFHLMREADAAGIKTLFVESVPRRGLGVAIMDRLERAALGQGENKNGRA